MQALLADRLDGGVGFVFGTRFGAAVRNLDAEMRRVCEWLGIERLTPHDLRRTFGSMVTALGFGRAAMDRILNHADNSIGSVYDRHCRRSPRHGGGHGRLLALAEGRETEDTNVVHLAR